jgi:hypothetical protein
LRDRSRVPAAGVDCLVDLALLVTAGDGDSSALRLSPALVSASEGVLTGSSRERVTFAASFGEVALPVLDLEATLPSPDLGAAALLPPSLPLAIIMANAFLVEAVPCETLRMGIFFCGDDRVALMIASSLASSALTGLEPFPRALALESAFSDSDAALASLFLAASALAAAAIMYSTTLPSKNSRVSILRLLIAL